MTSIADQIVDPLAEARATKEGAKDGAAAAAPAISLPAAGERELRLDLFRGIALWVIFIDHLSPKILTWVTLRNYGFSDATEIFISSPATAAFVYGRAMQEAGFVVATGRAFGGSGRSRRARSCSRSSSPRFPTSPQVREPALYRRVGIMDFRSLMSPSSRRCCCDPPVNMDVLPLHRADAVFR
jgi:hypothetical protein